MKIGEARFGSIVSDPPSDRIESRDAAWQDADPQSAIGAGCEGLDLIAGQPVFCGPLHRRTFAALVDSHEPVFGSGEHYPRALSPYRPQDVVAPAICIGPVPPLFITHPPRDTTPP